MNEPILEVRHLSKSFGANVVLRDIDFTVSPGDVTTVPVHRPRSGGPMADLDVVADEGHRPGDGGAD